MEKVKLIMASSSEGFQIPVFVALKSNIYFAEKSPLPLTATLLEILFRISALFIFCDPKCTASLKVQQADLFFSY